ncbi:MAG: hypothetical protein A2172_01115 [Candidatus Woykebacteria bacterium RBG_13_40_15]|uniref:Pilus assembly protein PilO n=1 Tax=Candidatus Woykebacteria bacterium RBG_13_40_15 TaxID=1802593 RepID=A0A1G1W9X8_9BACT|nr:MAG: hypothetical protein A2172_01115 [Candidatus Woykebacteria bacterium RBG_13_40_15]
MVTLSKQTINKAVKSSQAKDYFYIIASLILLIVLVLIMFPAVKYVAQLNREISDARIIKSGLETKINSLAEARKNYDEVKDNIQYLDSTMPVGSSLPSYLKGIEQLVADSKLTISNIQFTNVPLAKTPKTTASLQTKRISYKLTLTGNFLDFQDFLSDLEKFIRVSHVTSINLAKDKEGILKEALEIDTFFLGIPANTPPNQLKTGVPNE